MRSTGSRVVLFAAVLVSLAPRPRAALTQAPAPSAEAAVDANALCAEYAAALAGKPKELLEVGERLLQLGPAAAPALPSVVEALNHRGNLEVREQARKLLNAIGRAAVMPLVRRAIESGFVEVEGLRLSGDEALSGVFDLLESASEYERKWIAVVLDNMGDPAVEELRRRIRDDDGTKQLRAVQAARALAWRGGPLVDELAALVKSDDATLRYWATFALGGATPSSTPHLIAALDSGDARVRIAAAEGIEKSFDGVRSSPKHPDVEAYEMWHGVTRDMNREYKCYRAVADGATPRLAKALSDSEPLVRMFAAMSLYKLGSKAAEARAALLEAAQDQFPYVRVWSTQALARLDDSNWPRTQAFARVVATTSVPATTEQVDLWTQQLDDAPEWDPDPDDDAEDDKRSWNPEDDARFEAARRLASARGFEWLAAAQGEEAASAASAKERLDNVERALWGHVATLLWLSREEFDQDGPAQRALASLGATIAYDLRFDLLRYPRFPIGEDSFDAVTSCLSGCGDAGLAALALGLEHWSIYARPVAAHMLTRNGESAASFATALVSAWRCVGEDPRAPGAEAWWEGDDRSTSELPAGWTVTSSDGDTGGWGDPDGALRRNNVEFVARQLGVGALDTFTRALTDEHALVRARAAASLMALGEKARPSMRALAARLDDPEPAVRRAAAFALLAIAPDGSPEKERAKSEAPDAKSKR